MGYELEGRLLEVCTCDVFCPCWVGDDPFAYLRLSDAYQAPADAARRLGWPVIELASNNRGVLTDAEVITGALLDVLVQLER